MAPEIILGKGYSYQVDLWSFGILIYEMACGRLPFGECSDDPFSIYEEVMDQVLKYPRKCKSTERGFIERLLRKNPQERLGNGFEELKENNFFSNTDWKKILKKEIQPFHIPKK